MLFQKFALFQNLDQDQINTILAKNDLYNLLDPSDLSNLPEVNVNNFVNICNFVDYYQLLDDHEFLENIRYHIFNKTPEVINEINQLPINMQYKIYDHECIPNMKCRCIPPDKYNKLTRHHIKHICCYKFLSQNNHLSREIDMASRYGYLELVKYLIKIGKDYSYDAIIGASKYGYLEIIKCLFETTYYVSSDAIESAIYYACDSDHFEVFIYLYDLYEQTNGYEYILNQACMYGYLEVVKYIIEVKNKKYTKRIKENASKRVLAYLLSKPDSFIE